VTDTKRDAKQKLSEGQRSAIAPNVVSSSRLVLNRRYQVSLRFIFVAVAIVAAGFALLRAEIQQVADERHAVNVMQTRGAEVRFETAEEAGVGMVKRLARRLEARVAGRDREFPCAVEAHLLSYTDPDADIYTPCFVTPADLVHLKSTPLLRTLRLDGQPRITDSALVNLAALAGLEVLGLSGTAVTDDAFKYLAHIRELKRISLSDTSITDAAIAHLPRWRMLQGVTLDRTKITDDGLIHLGMLTQLKYLYLDETKITDDGLIHLGKLTQLECLYLQGTQITDVGLAHLRQLTNLQYLGLDTTLVTDEGLSSLAAMPKLKLLALRRTSVTDAGCSRLKQSLTGLTVKR
jgi:hypothetical protein